MRNQYQFKVIITLEEGDECTQDEIKDIVEDYLELGCNNESIGGNCKVESLSDIKDKLVKYFTTIENMAEELTTGNVAHKKAAIKGFAGPVQIIEAGKDDCVPHRTVENYCISSQSNMLAYHLMSEWPHALGGDPTRNFEYQKLLLDWLKTIPSETHRS